MSEAKIGYGAEGEATRAALSTAYSIGNRLDGVAGVDEEHSTLAEQVKWLKRDVENASRMVGRVHTKVFGPYVGTTKSVVDNAPKDTGLKSTIEGIREEVHNINRLISSIEDKI